ncbi:hypothetical protein NSK_005810 [Nannochloropsis salina CCMP1776]|uniref:AAA+ ATPase domain-containing protein n=1 Tax=Nannochloropsis salina CCMP1776 TaxID=1027361 RepID=A0A4D9CWD3_9STRA|nr:hypothetical protein NSK_005810 [Nannochloropsis salina CCMP1776]|eukprot:TFJ82894.1 hypothetical protein NSK_005810 [Nannochloropsis salina CCMP1776]
MMALMGPSGAGKTTLLDVLAGRKTGHGKISGSILHNGLVLPSALRPVLTAYVDQNSSDVHSPHMTPHEILCFSVALRLPRACPTLSPALYSTFVDAVLKLLRLERVKDSIVGPPSAGLSFEEMKRVSIATEVVAFPSLLFLDEPTTFLDSDHSLVVIQMLRELARGRVGGREGGWQGGMTVIASIHQPSKEVFELFDSLLMLGKGGNVVYVGPTRGENGVVAYFEKLPGIIPLEERKEKTPHHGY